MSHNHQNRVREHFADEAVQIAEEGYEQAQEAIRKDPVTITLAAFGIGLAVGTAAAILMSRSSRPTRTGSLEAFGRRVLDSLGDVLPESVRQHLPR